MATPTHPDVLLEPVRVPSVADEVTDRLVTAVAVGAFAPGEHLPAERELASMLGVSRSTVREGIARLREAGLVETRRGRSGGAFVLASWTPASASAVRRTLEPALPDLEPLFDLRARVEEMVARAAAERCTAQDAAVLREALAAFAAARGPAQEHASDRRLHDAVLQVTANPHLVALRRDLLGRVGLGLPLEPYRAEVFTRALAEHADLVAAITGGEVERAGQVARSHFAMSAEALRETLARGLGAEGPAAQRSASATEA